ncbi:DUF3397 family protein [Lacticigenium naphthae]|uniref:DUF3397 family protein n=1 Tax=Lacticigenium naphthae TaxID=515351 RepID=UPI00047F7EE8
MNNFQISIGIEYVALYFLPIVLLLFLNRPIKRLMKNQQRSFRLVDFLLPYLLLNIYFFTINFYSQNWFLVSLLIHLFAGFFLTVQLARKKRDLSLVHFFHIWWRYGFIIYFVAYIILGFKPVGALINF